MKNIKKFIYVFFAVLILFSCEKDESLDPRPLEVDGNYVRLDITSRVLNFDKLNETSVGGLLTTPGNNVSKYELFVRQKSGNVTLGNYKKMMTITSFPTDLKITPQIIADGLQVPLSSLKVGEFYEFLGYSYDENGKIFGYTNLSSVVRTQASMKQGFKFITTSFPENLYLVQNDVFDNYTFL